MALLRQILEAEKKARWWSFFFLSVHMVWWNPRKDWTKNRMNERPLSHCSLSLPVLHFYLLLCINPFNPLGSKLIFSLILLVLFFRKPLSCESTFILAFDVYPDSKDLVLSHSLAHKLITPSSFSLSCFPHQSYSLQTKLKESVPFCQENRKIWSESNPSINDLQRLEEWNIYISFQACS